MEIVNIILVTFLGGVAFVCLTFIVRNLMRDLRDDYHRKCEEKLDAFTETLTETANAHISAWRQKYEAEHRRAEELQRRVDELQARLDAMEEHHG